MCNKECATCYKDGSDYCFACSKGYFKLKEYTYPVPYRGQCTACNDPEKGYPHCLECNSLCSDDSLGDDSECKFTCTKCDDGFYLSDDASQCIKCDYLRLTK